MSNTMIYNQYKMVSIPSKVTDNQLRLLATYMSNNCIKIGERIGNAVLENDGKAMSSILTDLCSAIKSGQIKKREKTHKFDAELAKLKALVEIRNEVPGVKFVSNDVKIVQEPVVEEKPKRGRKKTA